MIKRQEIFIESFRHRSITKDIAENKKQISQEVIDKGGLTPGSTDPAPFPCGPWGPWGQAPTPCPPRDTPRGELDDFDLVDFTGMGNAVEELHSAPVQDTAISLSGPEGWLRRDVDISTPDRWSYLAANATGGFLTSRFEGTFQAIIGGDFFDFYSGAVVIRKGFTPTVPFSLFMKFTWINLGEYEGAKLTILLRPASLSSREIIFTGPNVFSSFPAGSVQITGSSRINFNWIANHSYSLRCELNTNSFRIKIWLSSETEPSDWTLSNSSSTSGDGAYKLRWEPAHAFLEAQQLPGIIKISYIDIDGVAFLDCDSVLESDGSIFGSFDPFGFLFGLDELFLNQVITGALTRITESRFLLPGKAESIRDVYIDGVHAEPGTHYEFIPPDIIVTTTTYPVSTKITATWVALSEI